MIPYLVMLALIIPALKNRKNHSFLVIIVLYFCQAAMQLTLDSGNPYINFICVIAYSVPYGIYALNKSKNQYWDYLSVSSMFVAAITAISIVIFAMFEGDLMPPERALVSFQVINIILLFTTIAQLYLIIRATDGYRNLSTDIESAYHRWALAVFKGSRK